MSTLDRDLIKDIHYQNGFVYFELNNKDSISCLSTLSGDYEVVNGIAKIKIESNPLQLDDAKIIFKSGDRIALDTHRVPQLFGRFPSNELSDDLKMLITRQNAQFIKQPYLRIGNAISYAYRSLETKSNIDIDIAFNINLYLLDLTYDLKQSDNCKNDKFHLRMSIIYVLMQLEIARCNENGFIKYSEELLSLIFKVKDLHNFKDSFYNVVRALLLIHTYSMLSKDKNRNIIFNLVLSLAKSSLCGFDETRVEKTYLEMSESISVMSLFKKGWSIDIADVFIENGIRLNKNKEYIVSNFKNFSFNFRFYNLGDLVL